MKDLLGRARRVRSGIHLGPAVPGVMANLSTSETSPFSCALCAFLGGKFLKSDDVDFHGVRVGRSSGRRGVLGSEVGGSGSSPDLVNAQFLVMEGFCFHNPSFEGVRWVLHG